MNHPIRLTLNNGGTGESTSVAGAFTDEEWQRLEDFLAYAEELFETRLICGGARSSLNLKWDQQSGLAADATLPPWEDVIVFLHKARPLILQDEPTSFGRVRNILARSLAHPYLRRLLDDHLRVYDGRRMRSAWTMRINEYVLNCDKALSDWLNACEYHRDQDKRELIESLQVMLPLPALQAIFIHLLIEKTEALFEMARLVRLVLGKQSEMEFRTPE